MEYAATICEFLGITLYELLGIENTNKIQAAYDVADPGSQGQGKKS